MIEKIKQICLKNKDFESCGLFILTIDKNVLYFPCENIHSSPETDFEISINDLRVAERLGEVIGVYHSHTKNCLDEPSIFDIAYSEATGYFNIIYIMAKDKICIVDQDCVLTDELKEKIGL